MVRTLLILTVDLEFSIRARRVLFSAMSFAGASVKTKISEWDGVPVRASC